MLVSQSCSRAVTRSGEPRAENTRSRICTGTGSIGRARSEGRSPGTPVGSQLRQRTSMAGDKMASRWVSVRMNAGDPAERLFSHPPLLHRVTPPEVVWSSFELPFSPSDRPYWASFAAFPIAVSGDTIFVMSGLRYPITVIDGSGETVGTFGTPSVSFRPIRVLERGALADLASYGTTLPELLASFDVIDRMDAVGPHLVLTRAKFDPERPMAPREVLHTSIEVYDRHTGVKLYEDVPLPEGSRVLGGGRFLYLLLDRHTPPWRIAKLRFLAQ